MRRIQIQYFRKPLFIWQGLQRIHRSTFFARCWGYSIIEWLSWLRVMSLNVQRTARSRIPGIVRKYLPIILKSWINHVHLLKINKRTELNIPELQEAPPFFFLNKLFTIHHENLTATICVSRDLQNFSNKIQLYKRALE